MRELGRAPRWLAGVTLGVAVAGSLLGWTAAPAGAQDLRELFRRVAPSVVTIRARGREVTTQGQTRFQGTGSGVLVSKDGKVMTAAHVVHAVDEIAVQFLGGETVSARVLTSEPGADLSLLQLERVPSGASVAPMADSDTVQVGDQVIVVGAPYGLSHSLSVGHISARWAPNTVYGAMPLAEFFQTDAVINTGNSGGPMFSMAGEVVGIVSHNISKSGGSEGLGFVVTLNTARQILFERRSFWSGLEGLMLSDTLAALLNVPPPMTGYIVKTVAKDSPAEQLRIRGASEMVTIDGQDVPLGGDIILAIQGVPMRASNMDAIRDALSALPPGHSFKISVLRAGRVVELVGRIP